MEAFFVVLVVGILLIRGLAKLGATGGGDPPRPRTPKKVILPPKRKPARGGASPTSPGVHPKSAGASAKPGVPRTPKIRRPIFGRRKTPDDVEVPPVPQGPGSETYIRYLIDILRVGEPAATRQAVARLVEIGRPALPALQEAARDPTPFVRERAQHATRQILERLTLAGDPTGARAEPPPVELPPPAKAPPPPRPEPARPLPEEPPGPPPAPVVEEAAEPPSEAEEEAPAREEEPARAALDPGDVEALAAVLREAAAEPGFGGRRDEILETIVDAIVRFTVVVNRVQWTGSLGVSPDYRGGRTLGGAIQGVDVPVAVCLPPERNAWADARKDGDRFAFLGVYVAWDGMYDRGKFEGDLLEEPE